MVLSQVPAIFVTIVSTQLKKEGKPNFMNASPMWPAKLSNTELSGDYSNKALASFHFGEEKHQCWETVCIKPTLGTQLQAQTLQRKKDVLQDIVPACNLNIKLEEERFT